MLFALFSAVPQAGFLKPEACQTGGLPEISRWLTERGSAEMASPQAMARSSGHDRMLALAGGHGHNEVLRTTPPVMN
jgi:hypothetical protein